MRVLYCTDTYPPQLNGVSVVTSLSVEGLARRGWECAVVAPRYPEALGASDWDGGDVAASLPIEVVCVSSVPLPSYPEIRLALPPPRVMSELVRRFRPDLVHCATEFGVGRMGQIAASRSGYPWCRPTTPTLPGTPTPTEPPGFEDHCRPTWAGFTVGAAGSLLRRPSPERTCFDWMLPTSRSGDGAWMRSCSIPVAAARRCGRPSAWAAASPSSMSGGWPPRSGPTRSSTPFDWQAKACRAE